MARRNPPDDDIGWYPVQLGRHGDPMLAWWSGAEWTNWPPNDPRCSLAWSSAPNWLGPRLHIPDPAPGQ